MKVANFDATYQELLTGAVGIVATSVATGAATSKPVVRVATTTAGTLATSFENGDMIDGITLATGDRILIKDQAAGAENGIYVVEASGAPTRAADFDASTEIVGAIIPVLEGTTNGATLWHNTNTGTVTVDTTALTFQSLTAGLSVLTTKGDLWGYSTADARVPVGSSGQILTADPAQALGLKWAAPPGAHAHVAGETHLSDGSTTTYTLDDYYEPGTVIAWNTTTLARLVVTEVLPDKATVSAAGTSGDKIVFDYAASL